MGQQTHKKFSKTKSHSAQADTDMRLFVHELFREHHTMYTKSASILIKLYT